jgi:taurine dioxygenase
VSLEVTAFDAPLGAEVRGLDRASYGDPGVAAELLALVDEHLLVLLRHGDEPPTEAEVSALCRSIGPVRPTLADRSRLPGFPEINRVSNRDADGVVGTGGSDTVTWHSDLSFQPPLIEFIYLDALTIPGRGGDTCWTNLCAAYEALAPALRARIDPLGARYRLRDGLDFSGYFKASDPASLFVDTEISLVQTNPRTGRRAVWPNTGPDFAVEVLGLDPDDGRALLTELYEHATRDEFVYRHRWRTGDAFLWCNTHTLHQRERFPDSEVRVMRHVNILGRADPRQLAGAAT